MKKLRGEFSGIYCLLFDLSGRSLGVLEGTKHGSLLLQEKGCRLMSGCMERFLEFIDDNELVDLLLSGSKYTWSNNQETVAMSRIDRFLIFKEWEEHFADGIQIAMPRGLLDHRPIKLNYERVNWGPRLFKFENCWLL